MKFVIMFGALGLGILFGFFPNLNKPKPLWWKLTVAIAVALALILSIYPRIAGTINDVKFVENGYYKEVDVELIVKKGSHKYIPEQNLWTIELDGKGKNINYSTFIVKGEKYPEELNSDKKLILKLTYNKDLQMPEYLATDYVDPLLIYPFVPSLDERIKILNLHVPQAWVAVVAYLISMIFAAKYLKTKNPFDDLNAASAASLGTLFAILATVTGMFWAKYNWGTYWNWDPRQSSIFVLIMIYFAYFALRSAIDNDEKRARLSSVYSIIAFITVPFLVFILPRMAKGLHPGSADDVNAGPVVSQQTGSLDTTLIFGFGLSLFAFTALFFWIYNIVNRYYRLKYEIENV